ncbi:MAG: hypothetical protein E6R09_07330 [Rhodocyclaceae bacterium]|jgi:hypothetical protein|nr:MAG: hypothetical protein E6R09_07330 [Rhodocyclaceae bacterium]
MRVKTAAVLPDLVESDETICLSNRRRDVALEAAWELEELAVALACWMPRSENALAVRGIAVRVRDLARISMSALSDTSDSTDDLLLRLTLEKVAEVTA